MSNSKNEATESTTLQTDLKAEQALGLIGLGLMQKMTQEGTANLNWLAEEAQEKADLLALRQRLELTALAIQTGAPLSTSEVTQLLGARPGSAKTERGGLTAKRISRNVWKLSRSEADSAYWRN
ncbi:hypothetical protein [Prochlorococcus sp. MIT 1300]|uniref:hypothetical protein n=1 Tax=Prochlorococcus sp. MIT 1300 TaxID=3096218 RepID=UPI002A75550A|nr:hypothetical protein [Prochlorococcus sp. MIT 1300]